MSAVRILLSASCAVVAGALAPLAAQGCPGPGTFWQRDTLPVVLAGLTGGSGIGGALGDAAALHIGN